jgi:hypothetical protein
MGHLFCLHGAGAEGVAEYELICVLFFNTVLNQLNVKKLPPW